MENYIFVDKDFGESDIQKNWEKSPLRLSKEIPKIGLGLDDRPKNKRKKCHEAHDVPRMN